MTNSNQTARDAGATHTKARRELMLSAVFLVFLVGAIAALECLSGL